MITPKIKQLAFDKFIENRKKEGDKVIILLAGKRDVPKSDQPKLIELGKKLASSLPQAKFRSGNAGGADSLFSSGVAAVDASRLEVIVPYTGHRSSENVAYNTISLDDIPLAKEASVLYNSKQYKPTKSLVDSYVKGTKNHITDKAKYIIRDTIMVIGTKEIQKCTFAIFYDNLKDPGKGGTGHTMDTCNRNMVKHIDQSVWFDWL